MTGDLTRKIDSWRFRIDSYNIFDWGAFAKINRLHTFDFDIIGISEMSDAESVMVDVELAHKKHPPSSMGGKELLTVEPSAAHDSYYELDKPNSPIGDMPCNPTDDFVFNHTGLSEFRAAQLLSTFGLNQVSYPFL